MILFLIYLVLSAISCFTIYALIRIIRKSNSLVLAVPIFAIFFWSIFGAWGMVEMHREGMHHFYEHALFFVYNDYYYLASIILYSLFLFIYIFRIFGYINSLGLNNMRNRRIDIFQIKDFLIKLQKSKLYFVVICIVFAFFFYFAKQDISNSIISGISAYELSRFDSSAGNLRTLFQFSGDTFSFLSIPLFVPTGKFYCRTYFIVLLYVIFVIFNFLLGNRGVLLTSVCVFLLLFTEIHGVKNFFTIKRVLFFVLLLLFVQLISFLRGMTVESLFAGGSNVSLMSLLESLTGANEKYAGHISMYGVLKYDVPFTYGSSFLYLLSSIIPAFIGVERPVDSYDYYITQVGAGDLEQGFTINHVTGWYINFGIIGVIIGALVWSSILLWFYKKRSGFLSMYAAIIFSVLSIQMIRAGIESYKGVLIMSILIPILIMKFSLVKFTWRNA